MLQTLKLNECNEARLKVKQEFTESNKIAAAQRAKLEEGELHPLTDHDHHRKRWLAPYL